MTAHTPRLPIALDPLIKEANRRMRRRRFSLALALVAVIAVGSTLELQSGGPTQRFTNAVHDGIHASSAGTARVGGLEIALPTRLYHHKISFGSVCRRHCMVTLANSRVRTFAWSSSASEEATPVAKTRVMLSLYVWTGPSCAGGAGHAPCAPTLRLPVTLTELARPWGVRAMKYGTWRSTIRYTAARGAGLYAIDLWIGRNTSRADRAAALAALRSIRVAAK